MKNMLFSTKRARERQPDLCIQDFISGIIQYNTLVFNNIEVFGFKNLICLWANKNKIHSVSPLKKECKNFIFA
ncbi:Uncharacterized protein dnm_010920 [Desulfonema magnum]|uniref:Uncharacterized protein n=1 Tax=Desulfonema magnum TaxID=45655 RepID=A0A975BGY3_9BACT|nr:Uncharacterized protein dnm_010920 [Desulfonema magnum]